MVRRRIISGLDQREVLGLVRDEVQRIKDAMALLVGKEVLVGFPEETNERHEELTGVKAPITNAVIAYIQDNGAPEKNIPARPFMIPGLEAAQTEVADILHRAARESVTHRDGGLRVERYLHRAGLRAANSIKMKINEGIPPPLSERTLRDRARRGREGAMWELAWREAGAPAGTELAKPLVDTGQLRNAVTYVIRPRRRRR